MPAKGNARARAVTLPHASANLGAISVVHVAPPDGAEELALAEASAAGVAPVHIVTRLIGACAAAAGDGAAPGAISPIGPDRAAALSIGDREVILRALYARLHGPIIDACLDCTHCGETVEFTLDLDALTALPDPAAAPAPVPTGADIAAARDGAQLAARFSGVDDATLAALDPNADCTLSLVCPACEESFSAMLDGFTLIASAGQEGGGIFAQIDRIARAYGWSEAAIVALPPARRRIYDALASR